jgi:hypothetical protein
MQDLEFHELSMRWELMSGSQTHEMAENMRKNGYNKHIPIWLFEGKILDGRNRYTASKLAGVEPSFLTFEGSWESAEELEDVLNFHRRHSEEEALRLAREARVKRIEARRKAGQSLRSIAEAEDISEKQVRKDLKKTLAADGGSAAEPEGGKVKGKDGKKYPAKPKPPKKKPKPPEPENAIDSEPEATQPQQQDPEPTQEPEPEPATPSKATSAPLEDRAGNIITPESAEAFSVLNFYQEADQHVRALQKIINQIGNHPGGCEMRRFLRPVGPEGKTILKSDKLIELINDLKYTRPYSICCRCKGKASPDCKSCCGRGWWTETTYKGANPETTGAKR